MNGQDGPTQRDARCAVGVPALWVGSVIPVVYSGCEGTGVRSPITAINSRGYCDSRLSNLPRLVARCARDVRIDDCGPCAAELVNQWR